MRESCYSCSVQSFIKMIEKGGGDTAVGFAMNRKQNKTTEIYLDFQKSFCMGLPGDCKTQHSQY